MSVTDRGCARSGLPTHEPESAPPYPRPELVEGPRDPVAARSFRARRKTCAGPSTSSGRADAREVRRRPRQVRFRPDCGRPYGRRLATMATPRSDASMIAFGHGAIARCPASSNIDSRHFPQRACRILTRLPAASRRRHIFSRTKFASADPSSQDPRAWHGVRT